MSIPHPDEAAHCLSRISFHRLRGYWEPFEDPSGNGDGHHFRDGTSFSDVIERYNFDQQLRTLLADAFNHVEIAVRTQWAYNLAYVNGGGRFAHHNAGLFLQGYDKNMAMLKDDYEKYGNKKYHYHYHFADCPIWAIVEIMSFGQLSAWYGDTRLPGRRLVARHYGVDEKILKSLLRHLVVVRNICAHHERLWDRKLVSPFRIPNRLGDARGTQRFFNRDDNGKIYNALVMVAYMMGLVSPASNWKRRLLALLDQYGCVPETAMGFLPGWRRLAFGKCERLRINCCPNPASHKKGALIWPNTTWL